MLHMKVVPPPCVVHVRARVSILSARGCSCTRLTGSGAVGHLLDVLGRLELCFLCPRGILTVSKSDLVPFAWPEPCSCPVVSLAPSSYLDPCLAGSPFFRGSVLSCGNCVVSLTVRCCMLGLGPRLCPHAWAVFPGWKPLVFCSLSSHGCYPSPRETPPQEGMDSVSQAASTVPLVQ